MSESKPSSDTTPSWDALHEVANAQAGHFTAQQAAEVGFSAQLLYKHVRSGNVTRPARAVYRISRFPPGEHEDLVVLWLGSGQEAVFSHETALRLHDLSDALPGRVHLTLPVEMRGRKHPEGAVVHYGPVPKGDRDWLGPLPITTPLRATLDVAAAHGDASVVAQAIDQGIRRGLFTASGVAPAAAYVAAAQGYRMPAGRSAEEGLRSAATNPGAADLDLRDDFYARPFRGTCAEPPPSDWPTLAAEIGRVHGAVLRVAQYFPSRTLLVEFAWPVDGVPKESEVKKLRKRLAARFSWA